MGLNAAKKKKKASCLHARSRSFMLQLPYRYLIPFFLLACVLAHMHHTTASISKFLRVSPLCAIFQFAATQHSTVLCSVISRENADLVSVLLVLHASQAFVEMLWVSFSFTIFIFICLATPDEPYCLFSCKVAMANQNNG